MIDKAVGVGSGGFALADDPPDFKGDPDVKSRGVG
jgi:hypothetical protein